jgi:hypothetical protein
MHMKYRCEATSLEGFVQLLAANYLPHGYWFYVTGRVPVGKDPRAVDEKLLSKYGIGLSRQQRARRKQAGFANVHYLRLGRLWVLVATHGHHSFFSEETDNVRDARRVPIQVGGYSLSVKRGQFLKKELAEDSPKPDGKYRVRVQISRERYRELQAYLLGIACHRTVENLAREFWIVPYEPYAPIRKQLLNLVRLVNEKRQGAGYSKISATVLRLRRRIVRPFEPSPIDAAAKSTTECESFA